MRSVDTAIGILPAAGSINMQGLNLKPGQEQELFELDKGYNLAVDCNNNSGPDHKHESYFLRFLILMNFHNLYLLTSFGIYSEWVAEVARYVFIKFELYYMYLFLHIIYKYSPLIYNMLCYIDSYREFQTSLGPRMPKILLDMTKDLEARVNAM